MPVVLIIGAGRMGRAVAVPLSDNGHAVYIAPARPEVHREGLPPGLNAELLERLDLDYGLLDPDLVIVAVNSSGLAQAHQLIAEHQFHNKPILLLTKGLLAAESLCLITLPEFTANFLTSKGAREPEVYFLGGPYVADELASRCNTSVILAGRGRQTDRLRMILGTHYLHIHRSREIRRVAFNAALKNLYAIAVGFSAGRESLNGRRTERIAKNPAAVVFSQALCEMGYLSRYLKFSRRQATDLSNAGDLFATCGTGRNHRAGLLLGQGVDLRHIETNLMPGETIEGIAVARTIAIAFPSLLRAAEETNLQVPLLRFLLSIIVEHNYADLPWDLFF